MTRQQRISILIAAAGITAIALVLFPRVPQPQEYHRFADQRSFLGMANAWNVLSNLAFLAAGVWGLRLLIRRRGVFLDPIERLPYAIFFVGVVLTCFGSGYYHLAPDNASLVWDRLPMTLGFTALLYAIMGERLGLRIGLRSLPLFMLAGLASVVYWIATENASHGDLRPYIFIQFFPMIAIPVLIALFPPRYTRAMDLILAVAIYVLAKILEGLDTAVYTATGHLVSGHTLKHVVAAAAVVVVIRMLQKRRPK